MLEIRQKFKNIHHEQNDIILIKKACMWYFLEFSLKWISVECIIRNSSLPLLGGRNDT